MTPTPGQLWQLLSVQGTVLRVRLERVADGFAEGPILGSARAARLRIAVSTLTGGRRAARLLEHADGRKAEPRRVVLPRVEVPAERTTASDHRREVAPKGMSDRERAAWTSGRWP